MEGMEGKFGPMALPTARPSVVRSGRNFASMTSKRHQAPEKTRFIYFHAEFRHASAVRAAEAGGDCLASEIDDSAGASANLIHDEQAKADDFPC